MIEFVKGNIFDADVEALVNPVNCVGIMGKGLALQFKKKFPDYYKHYANACKERRIILGNAYFYINLYPDFRTSLIVSFPTKYHWQDKSRLWDITQGLEMLSIKIRDFKVKSIAIPALGCGLGGLDWADVLVTMQDKLKSLSDTRILVYEPKDIETKG